MWVSNKHWIDKNTEQNIGNTFYGRQFSTLSYEIFSAVSKCMKNLCFHFPPKMFLSVQSSAYNVRRCECGCFKSNKQSYYTVYRVTSFPFKNKSTIKFTD